MTFPYPEALNILDIRDPLLERTAARYTSFGVRRACAAAAAQRPYVMPLRRNLKQLQQSVAKARSSRARAAALFRLAVFHDNNGREAAAIPHYRHAIALGLDANAEVRAFAWLGSSLHKTGRPAAAMRCVKQALAGPCPRGLRTFLTRLEGRIRHRQRTGAA